VVFAIEALSRRFEEKTNGIVFTAVIPAGITARAVFGDYVYFGAHRSVMGGCQDRLAIPVCGVAGRGHGGLFGQILIAGLERIGPLRLI
jgi:hypothetical protein